MNDEFYIIKSVVTGSCGGKECSYNLAIDRLCTELNDITMEEIIRLNHFLSEYIKQEGYQK